MYYPNTTPSFPVSYSGFNKAKDTGICKAALTLQPITHHATNYVPDHGGCRGSFITYEAPIRPRLKSQFSPAV